MKTRGEKQINLSTPQLRQLCQDLESNGGLHAANFLVICNADPATYGPPGAFRRAFQKKVNAFKSLTSIATYIETLKQYNVEPSAQTLLRLQNQPPPAIPAPAIPAPANPTPAPAPAPQPESDSEPEPEPEPESLDDEEFFPSSPSLASSASAASVPSVAYSARSQASSALASVSSVAYSARMRKTAPAHSLGEQFADMSFPARSPPRTRFPSAGGRQTPTRQTPTRRPTTTSPAIARPTPPRRGFRDDIEGFPVDHEGIPEDVGLDVDDPFAFEYQSLLGLTRDLGTYEDPSLVLMRDITCVRANNNFSACPSYGVEHLGISYDTIVVFLSVPPPDQKWWNARVPHESEVDASIDGRCIIVSGPSMNFWQRQASTILMDRDCAKPLKDNGDLAKNLSHADAARKSNDGGIARDDRQYYLLIFEAGVKLDNRVFAGNDEGWIPPNPVDLNHPAPTIQTADSFKKDIIGMVHCWRVAYANTGKRLAGQNQAPSNSKFGC